MKITIVGTGYVGLVTAACFAEFGNDLMCLDLDKRKIEMLARGKVTIHEPRLQELVSRNAAAGRLRFTTGYDEAVDHADIIFLAVGTPAEEDGSADLSHVLAAARSIGQRAVRPLLVVNKSTVPVGTADEVRRTIRHELDKRGLRIPVNVLSNPEFLKEGAAVADFMRPDRIIIGSDDERAMRLMRSLYAPFNRNHDKLFITDVRSAELSKYAANAMLATRISFMNEIANLAEDLGADIDAVRHGIGSDARIGPHFLYAGMGYGGSCFPKDVKALLKSGRQHGRELSILAATEAVNEKQKTVLFEKLCNHFGGASELAGKTIALWGLAFKPNTGDMREAPSLALINSLLRSNCLVQAYDPVAHEEAKLVLQAIHGEASFDRSIRLSDNAWDAVENADALVLVTEWQEFRAPDFERLTGSLRGKALFDGRNLYNPLEVRAAGLHYYGIGRNAAPAFA
jgi:UDPglucose 6-dehydrogenase